MGNLFRLTDHIASTPIDIRQVKFVDLGKILKELGSQCLVDFESTKLKTILDIKLQHKSLEDAALPVHNCHSERLSTPLAYCIV